MSRLLALAAFGLCVAAAVARPAAAQTYELKIATVAPDTTPWAALLKEYKANVEKLMIGVAKLDVPLVVEAGVGDNWDKAH